ncbi:hypothetical protein GF389_00250 [Candidatus Dojkabacteria bacterium]|nr:hypothetical protein [Candidatus Dojkabacteria bacterium]
MSEINKYNKLLQTSKTVFSVDDLAQIWPGLSRDSLLDKIKFLLKTNKIIGVKRGLYAIPSREIDLNELGAKTRSPSYISFYTVLAKAGVIFQYYEDIYLASNNSEEMNIYGQRFIYKKLKDEILFNPKGIIQEENYQIASPERAYLDTLYLNPGKGFDNEEKLDVELCFDLLGIYDNERLKKEVERRLK